MSWGNNNCIWIILILIIIFACGNGNGFNNGIFNGGCVGCGNGFPFNGCRDGCCD